MDEKTIRDMFGWAPEPEAPNFRKIKAGSTEFLQILVPMGGLAGYACIPLSGRPDMSRPYGCESVLEHLGRRLDLHVREHGSDEGFRLDEDALDDIRDEILDFYRRRRFLLETAAPAGEFGVVVRDGEHALELMDMVDTYSGDSERAWSHRKYEPYIRCHITEAQALLGLRQSDYPRLIAAVRDGIEAIDRFDRAHDTWEYADIDESIYPRRLIHHLRDIAVRLLEKGQEDAVEHEEYERAGAIRDLITQFEKEYAE